MRITIALGGDTMVGPGVGTALTQKPARSFFSPELVEVVQEADLCIVNLECCISDRGTAWPSPGKLFFFRAPPRAVEILNYLGVDCVNLANNHSLDYGPEALLDTITHLNSAGIRWVGAGPDLERARAPVVLRSGDFRLGVLGFADHPAEFGAALDVAGTAIADLAQGVPEWVTRSISGLQGSADAVLLSPHWGPNFTPGPLPHIRAAAQALGPRVTLIAGHSAHVFHGVQGNVLYDLGDFLQTYTGMRSADSLLRRALRRGAREVRSLVGRGKGLGLRPRAHRLWQELQAARLHDHLGLLFLVTLDASGARQIEAVPLKLAHCYTRLAEGKDAAWITRRLGRACRALGTTVVRQNGRLVITGNRSSTANVGA